MTSICPLLGTKLTSKMNYLEQHYQVRSDLHFASCATLFQNKQRKLIYYY